MGTQRERRNYTDEFKRDAVALVTEHGYSSAEAARSLGINDNLIYKWRKDLQDQEIGKTLKPDEREELIRLRKENQQLKIEKEILKKASAYFAKEMK
jgi:transposase